jgi:hypothetical protein
MPDPGTPGRRVCNSSTSVTWCTGLEATVLLQDVGQRVCAVNGAGQYYVSAVNMYVNSFGAILWT